jgi:hypothetical protein
MPKDLLTGQDDPQDLLADSVPQASAADIGQNPYAQIYNQAIYDTRPENIDAANERARKSAIMAGATVATPFLPAAGIVDETVGSPLVKMLARNTNMAPSYGAAAAATSKALNPQESATETAKSGAEGALGPFALDAGLMTGYGAIPGIANTAKNAYLNYVERQAQTGQGILSPELAAQKMQSQYTDVNGNPMPVSIGELTGEPIGKGLTNTGSYLPTTGITGQQNKLQMQQIGNEEAGINQQIAPLQKALTDTQTARQQTESAAANAPDVLKGLAPAENISPNEFLKQEIQKSYKQASGVSDQWQKGIDAKIDALSSPEAVVGARKPEIPFSDNEVKSYPDSEGLFKDSNRPRNLTTNPGYQVPIKDVRSAITDLGNKYGAAQRAAIGGNSEASQNAAQYLQQRQALQQHLDTGLRAQGHNDLADEIQNFNDYHFNHVVPFKINSEVSKNVKAPLKLSEGAALANQLHDLSGQAVLHQLSPEAQQAAGQLLVSKGKDIDQMTPENIASKWKSLDKTNKDAMAIYAPEQHAYFNSLASHLQQIQDLKAAEKIHSQSIGVLQKQLAKNKAQQLNINPQAAGWEKLIAPAKLVGLGAAGYTHPLATALGYGALHTITKAASDPELALKYISGGRYSNSSEAPSLAKILQKIYNR